MNRVLLDPELAGLNIEYERKRMAELSIYSEELAELRSRLRSIYERIEENRRLMSIKMPALEKINELHNEIAIANKILADGNK